MKISPYYIIKSFLGLSPLNREEVQSLFDKTGHTRSSTYPQAIINWGKIKLLSGVLEDSYGPLAHVYMEGNPITYLHNADQFDCLLSHVNNGIQLAKKGYYQGATDLLQDQEQAKQTGIALELRTTKLEKLPEDGKELKDAYKRCRDAFFNHDLGTVVIPTLKFDQPSQNPRQRAMQKAIYYHEAVKSLEEWLHAVQFTSNTYVSELFKDSTPQIVHWQYDARVIPDGKNFLEHDIAAMFLENGIPVTENFLRKYDRYKLIEEADRIKISPFPPKED